MTTNERRITILIRIYLAIFYTVKSCAKIAEPMLITSRQYQRGFSDWALVVVNAAGQTLESTTAISIVCGASIEYLIHDICGSVCCHTLSKTFSRM